jgi:hypothetical protein
VGLIIEDLLTRDVSTAECPWRQNILAKLHGPGILVRVRALV